MPLSKIVVMVYSQSSLPRPDGQDSLQFCVGDSTTQCAYSIIVEYGFESWQESREESCKNGEREFLEIPACKTTTTLIIITN